MTIFSKILVGSAAVAALATAAPAAAQYAYPYAYNPYANNAYGYNPYGHQVTQTATQQCTAAVQSRLQRRTGLTGIVSALLGAPTQARVVSVTRVDPRRSSVRVRGLATSGRYAAYSPYGMGAYGAAGYAYQPDLSFRCDVDYRGFVRDVDITRRY